jgi:hypothetical protein
MYPGLLTLTLLGTMAADDGLHPAPLLDAASMGQHLALPAVLMRPQAPQGRRRRLPAWPYLEDDRDEEGARKADPPAALAPLAATPSGAIRAAQRTPALAAHPTVTPLIYTLCTLLL